MSKELEMDLEEEEEYFIDLFEKDKQPLTDKDLIELNEQQKKKKKEVKLGPCYFFPRENAGSICFY